MDLVPHLNLQSETLDVSTKGLLATVYSHSTPDVFMQSFGWTISKYSRARFTYPVDRLIAFLGVGELFGARRGSRFENGLLWTPYAAGQLLWTIEDHSKGSTNGLAPTWSRLNVSGPVKYDQWFSHASANLLEVKNLCQNAKRAITHLPFKALLFMDAPVFRIDKIEAGQYEKPWMEESDAVLCCPTLPGFEIERLNWDNGGLDHRTSV